MEAFLLILNGLLVTSVRSKCLSSNLLTLNVIRRMTACPSSYGRSVEAGKQFRLMERKVFEYLLQIKTQLCSQKLVAGRNFSNLKKEVGN